MRSEAHWENEICTAIATGRKIIWGYILYNYTVTVTGRKLYWDSFSQLYWETFLVATALNEISLTVFVVKF